MLFKMYSMPLLSCIISKTAVGYYRETDGFMGKIIIHRFNLFPKKGSSSFHLK